MVGGKVAFPNKKGCPVDSLEALRLGDQAYRRLRTARSRTRWRMSIIMRIMEITMPAGETSSRKFMEKV